jgi:hypothetical protein
MQKKHGLWALGPGWKHQVDGNLVHQTWLRGENLDDGSIP